MFLRFTCFKPCCSWNVLSFSTFQALRSYKLCSYKKKRVVRMLQQPYTAFCNILYTVMWNSLYLRYPSEMLTSILIILQNFTELACLEVATPKIVVGVMMYIGRKLVENLAATKSCSIQFMPMQHHCKVEHWSKFSINFQHPSDVAYHSKLLIFKVKATS